MSQDRILHVLPNDHRPTRIELFPHYEVKATSDDTEGRFSAVVVSMKQPLPLHMHDTDENFYVLEGEMEVYCGGKFFHCVPGTWMTLPREIPQAARRVGDKDPLLLLVQAPGGFEVLAEAFLSVQNSKDRSFTDPESLDLFASHGWKLIDGDFWKKLDREREGSKVEARADVDIPARNVDQAKHAILQDR